MLAIDDDGLLAVRFAVDAAADSEGADARIFYERLLNEPTVLSGGGSLLPGLSLTGDLDGDGELDLIYPLNSEYTIFNGRDPRLCQRDGGRYLTRRERTLRIHTRGLNRASICRGARSCS